MNDNDDEHQVDSPREKGRHRKSSSSSSLSLSALFYGHLSRRHNLIDKSSPDNSPRVVSPSKWIRTKHHSNDPNHTKSPDFKGRCRSIATRLGHHRRHTSDLTYDPTSYAQNFESDNAGDDDDSPLKNTFTARLRAGEASGTQRPQAVAESAGVNGSQPRSEGKKTRRKSFDLNELMTVAKSLEDSKQIPNGGSYSNRLEMNTMATIVEETTLPFQR
ncbi:unnamed protein product [Cuscuta epithymum]|uniref:Uncharacterized protein n=1 Tax=Cuscuta epithymum TaxID=186058 RepID=A0AAV0C2K6_9ASTE|nr:unnamed protein product [Cuscuta epithymum]CAH9136418.1 unnamed protein product [Cuscuta epithymum]